MNAIPVLLLFLNAAPLPPAVEKLHKDGIRLRPDEPAVLNGPIGGATPAAVHHFQMLKGQSYRLQINAPAGVALQIHDESSGALVFAADGKGSREIVREFLPPKDGVYRLTLEAPGEAGRYTLSVLHRATLVRRDPPGVRRVGKEGLLINENLAATDPVDKVRRRPCRTFDVRLEAGKTYQFDLMSRQFDCFLRIEDGAGAQIAFNDDGGDGLNSRIVMPIKAEGVYRMICTTFAGGEGAFTLQIRER
ncbi:MAG: hypothetical protein U0793_28485 [Gemmataceae bacterium]